jgi:hypothetical protein
MKRQNARFSASTIRNSRTRSTSVPHPFRTLIHDGLPPNYCIRLSFDALENEQQIAELRVEIAKNRRMSIKVLQEYGSEMETRLEVTDAQLKVAEIKEERGKLREEVYKVLDRAGDRDRVEG